jgi:hypothetical protein
MLIASFKGEPVWRDVLAFLVECGYGETNSACIRKALSNAAKECGWIGDCPDC